MGRKSISRCHPFSRPQREPPHLPCNAGNASGSRRKGSGVSVARIRRELSAWAPSLAGGWFARSPHHGRYRAYCTSIGRVCQSSHARSITRRNRRLMSSQPGSSVRFTGSMLSRMCAISLSRKSSKSGMCAVSPDSSAAFFRQSSASTVGCMRSGSTVAHSASNRTGGSVPRSSIQRAHSTGRITSRCFFSRTFSPSICLRPWNKYGRFPTAH